VVYICRECGRVFTAEWAHPSHRASWFFALGVYDHGLGNDECPYPPGYAAYANWLAGWADAEEGYLYSEDRARDDGG